MQEQTWPKSTSDFEEWRMKLRQENNIVKGWCVGKPKKSIPQSYVFGEVKPHLQIK